jgi:hypothetical protein
MRPACDGSRVNANQVAGPELRRASVSAAVARLWVNALAAWARRALRALEDVEKVLTNCWAHAGRMLGAAVYGTYVDDSD